MGATFLPIKLVQNYKQIITIVEIILLNVSFILESIMVTNVPHTPEEPNEVSGKL